MTDTARVVIAPLALDQLVSRPVAIPRMRRVRRASRVQAPPLDVRAELERGLDPVLAGISRGEQVAIGVGSRGIARLSEIVTSAVDLVRARGAEPYLVPAMGSHGGATAAGQLEILEGLGINEATVGAPIEPTMSTRIVGEADGMPVHVATALDAADHILVINRVKSHTSFTGEIESGLAKMVAIGLGKQRGAEQLHELGPLMLERRILAACRLITAKLPVRGGLAVVEDEHKGIAELQFLAGAVIGGPREAALLARARSLESRLPFDSIDVLIVDLMGKEISGTGMDTNVLGRRMVRGSPEPSKPRVTNVVVLGVTPGSHGNAVGLGLADFIPVSLLDQVDLAATYANALTAGLQGVQRAQIPIVLATDRDAVGAALVTAGVPDLSRARIVRIRSTLALDELMVTANLLDETPMLEEVTPHTEFGLFDPLGAIQPWPLKTIPPTGS